MATPLVDAIETHRKWCDRTNATLIEMAEAEAMAHDSIVRLQDVVRSSLKASAPLDDLTRDVLHTISQSTLVVTDDESAQHVIYTTLKAVGIDPDDIAGDMKAVARAAGIEYTEQAMELSFDLHHDREIIFDGSDELVAAFPDAVVFAKDDSWNAVVEGSIDDEQWEEVAHNKEYTISQQLEVTVCTLQMIEPIDDDDDAAGDAAANTIN